MTEQDSNREAGTVSPASEGYADAVNCNRCGRVASMCLCDSDNTDDLKDWISVLVACRNHWKAAWEDDRRNVIRLRRLVYLFHADNCVCLDCQIVQQHPNPPPRHND